MDIQLAIVILVVGASLLYLLRQAARTFRSSGKSGCTKGCGGCGEPQLVSFEKAEPRR